MSGHSKWATIHRQKEVNDAKRGAAFTKLAQAITIAVKQGGGVSDPALNFKLRLAVDKARQYNMPKDNITRAIERGVGGGDGANFSELTFEGFLPGGVAVLVDVLTDNKLRTAQQVREVIEKNGGTLGSSGSVGYLFSQIGHVVISNTGLTDDDELTLIDKGAIEVEKNSDNWVVSCNRDELAEFKSKLEQVGYVVTNFGIVMNPSVWTRVNEEQFGKIEVIVGKLLELDDVQNVWTNYELDDQV